MLYHVKEANVMLRRQDFNRDGISDCVGVHVSDIRVVTSPSVYLDEDKKAPVIKFREIIFIFYPYENF